MAVNVLKKTLHVSIHTGHNQARINKKDDNQISRTVHPMTLIILYEKALFHMHENPSYLLLSFQVIHAPWWPSESKHVAFHTGKYCFYIKIIMKNKRYLVWLKFFSYYLQNLLPFFYITWLSYTPSESGSCLYTPEAYLHTKQCNARQLFAYILRAFAMRSCKGTAELS